MTACRPQRRLASHTAALATALLCSGLVVVTPARSASTDPQALQQPVQPLPRVAHPYDPRGMDVGGASRVPDQPDAYRKPYGQYLGGWRETAPQLQSSYAPPGPWSPPPPAASPPQPSAPASAPAPAPAAASLPQPLPPLQETQIASTAKPPAPAAPQLAQAAPSAPAAPPPEDRLRYGAGSKYGVSELRFGVLAHNKGPIATHLEHGAQVNLEARFASPDFMKILFEPRPTLGASVNTAGDTSFLYGGLTWGGVLWKGLFLEGFFGMAVHDGELDSKDPQPQLTRKQMGSRVVFREAVEFGYRFFELHSVSFSIDHYSNAGWLAERNQGNDDLGLRYGYKF